MIPTLEASIHEGFAPAPLVERMYPAELGAKVVKTPEALKYGIDPWSSSAPALRSSPVPPFATGSIPVTSPEARFTAELERTPLAFVLTMPELNPPELDLLYLLLLELGSGCWW